MNITKNKYKLLHIKNKIFIYSYTYIIIYLSCKNSNWQPIHLPNFHRNYINIISSLLNIL